MNQPLIDDSCMHYGENLPFNVLYPSESFSTLLRQSDIVLIFCCFSTFKNEDYRIKIKSYIEASNDRDKKTIIIADDYRNSFEFSHLDGSLFSRSFEYLWIRAEDGLNIHSMNEIVPSIYNHAFKGNEKRTLYEKLAHFEKMKYGEGVLDTQSSLIEILWEEWENADSDDVKLTRCKAVLQLMSKMRSYYTSNTEEGRRIAHHQLDAISKVHDWVMDERFQTNDLYLSAWAIAIIYLFAIIQHEAVDTITYGDVYLLQKQDRIDSFFEEQKRFYQVIHSARDNGWEDIIDQYSKIDRMLIVDCDQYSMALIHGDSHGGIWQEREDGVYASPFPVKTPEESIAQIEMSDEMKLLFSAAETMKKGVNVFSEIADYGKAAEYLRCLKTFYERLRNYCEIVDSKVTAAYCIDQIVNIQSRLEKVNTQAKKWDVAEQGLKSLLGLRLQESNDYDVFLSYKHEDDDIARSCYYFLQENHIKTFFDDISLPELSKSDYEEAIMTALDRSKHFIVFITDLSQLSAHWIKLEMRIFEHEMSENRKPDANFIFITSNEVATMINANKKLLPIQYRGFEIITVSEYRKKLLNYLI